MKTPEGEALTGRLSVADGDPRLGLSAALDSVTKAARPASRDGRRPPRSWDIAA